MKLPEKEEKIAGVKSLRQTESQSTDRWTTDFNRATNDQAKERGQWVAQQPELMRCCRPKNDHHK